MNDQAQGQSKVSCPNCGGSAESWATICPHCEFEFPTKGSKRNMLFKKIEHRETALTMVKEISLLYFGLAAFQAIASYFLGRAMLIDAALYVICGFFLRKFSSRIAAVILLVAALVSAATTIANRFGVNLGGGGNIILSLFVLVAASRAVEATFKLSGRFAQKPSEPSVNPA